MSLEDRLNTDQPTAWRPDQSDSQVIVGKLVGVSTIVGYEGQPYPVLTIELADGTRKAVHAFHDVLKNELVGKRPRIGQEIGIKYLGKPEGKRYVAYRVEVDQQEGEQVDWGSVGDEAPMPVSDVPADFPVSSGVPNTADDDDIPF